MWKEIAYDGSFSFGSKNGSFGPFQASYINFQFLPKPIEDGTASDIFLFMNLQQIEPTILKKVYEGEEALNGIFKFEN